MLNCDPIKKDRPQEPLNRRPNITANESDFRDRNWGETEIIGFRASIRAL